MSVRQYHECSLADVEAALRYVESDCPRDEWVAIGMAIKSEFPDAFDLFDRWSQGAESYRAKDCRDAWRSFKTVGASGSVGIGTLFKRAMDRGFEFERREISAEEQARFARERAQRAERRREVEAQEKAEQEAWHDRIAQVSQQLWEGLKPAGQSKYLGTKRVRGHGVGFAPRGVVIQFLDTPGDKREVRLIEGADSIKRFFNDYKAQQEDNPEAELESFIYLKRGTVVVPVRDEQGAIVNLQLIFATGAKRFMKHGRKSGCCHQIGTVTGDMPMVAFAEGYATAASIHEATGWPAVVTFDCGNIDAVVGRYRQRYPQLQFIIAADDDRDTKGNPGVTKARQAAANHRAALAVPEFLEAC